MRSPLLLVCALLALCLCSVHAQEYTQKIPPTLLNQLMGLTANGEPQPDPTTGVRPHAGPGTKTNPLLFKRIFIMWFENHGYLQALFSKQWQQIKQRTTWMTNFHATTHPSQPNYVAFAAASTLDCNHNKFYMSKERSLMDLLLAKNVTYKFYQEDYVQGPNGACNDKENIDKLYYRKHNPGIYFESVRAHPDGCRNIVGHEQLDVDLANNDLPQFSFFTPNIDNDGHDTDMTFAGNWLLNWMDKYFPQPEFYQDTLFIATFDEDEYLEFLHVPAVMWGPQYVVPGTSLSAYLNHFSLTKLVEDNWGLGNLGRFDATAPDMLDIWRGKPYVLNEAGQQVMGSAGALLHNVKMAEKLTPEQRAIVLAGQGNEMMPMRTDTYNRLSSSPKDAHRLLAQDVPVENVYFNPPANPAAPSEAHQVLRKALSILAASSNEVVQSARLTLIRMHPVLFTGEEPFPASEIHVAENIKPLQIGTVEEGFESSLRHLREQLDEVNLNARADLVTAIEMIEQVRAAVL